MNMLQSSDQRMKSIKENTILSFNAAARHPLDFIEFDVQVSLNLYLRRIIFLGGLVAAKWHPSIRPSPVCLGDRLHVTSARFFRRFIGYTCLVNSYVYFKNKV